MPFQFTDVCQSLESGLSVETWSSVLSKIADSYETPLKSSPSYQQLLKPLEEKIDDDMFIIPEEEDDDEEMEKEKEEKENSSKPGTKAVPVPGTKPRRMIEKSESLPEAPSPDTIRHTSSSPENTNNDGVALKPSSGLSQVINQLFKNTPESRTSRNFFEKESKGNAPEFFASKNFFEERVKLNPTPVPPPRNYKKFPSSNSNSNQSIQNNNNNNNNSASHSSSTPNSSFKLSSSARDIIIKHHPQQNESNNQGDNSESSKNNDSMSTKNTIHKENSDNSGTKGFLEFIPEEYNEKFRPDGKLNDSDNNNNNHRGSKKSDSKVDIWDKVCFFISSLFFIILQI